MLKRKLGLLVAAAVMVGMFSSCVLNVKEDKNGEQVPSDSTPAKEEVAIDYTSYSNDWSLIVENETNIKLVAFKGAPAANSLIGGIPASSTHYLKNDTSIFKTTEDFVLFVVKEADYLANKDDFEKLATMPFTTFYAFYNKDSLNENHFKISKVMGGEYKITLNNGTAYNVELRNKGVTGNVIGYCAANSYETSFHVTEGEYMIFPVFRKYDSNTHEIISTYPTYQTGDLAGQAKSYEFSLDTDTKEKLYNAADWVKGINFTPSAAYIKIINNADQGLQFFTGADTPAEITSTGGKRINTTKSLVFPIQMDLLGNNKYEESKIVAGYRVGTNRISNIYLNETAATAVEYKAGFLYTYTITGDAETGYKVEPLKNGDELKAQEVDWSKL
jgi:hypothetical protein